MNGLIAERIDGVDTALCNSKDPEEDNNDHDSVCATRSTFSSQHAPLLCALTLPHGGVSGSLPEFRSNVFFAHKKKKT